VTKQQWQQVKSLLALALEQPPESRRAFLREAAADDSGLLHELESLLDAHDRPDGFSLDDAPPLSTRWIDDGVEGSADVGSYSKVCSRCHSRYGPLVFVCPQDGESLADDPEALVGVTLDGLYHIERLIGQGAMGRVYGARHALLQDRVAIKVLRSDLALNADFVKRFLREGRAARSINHPNVVTVHDLRTSSEGLTYMVQEYVDGQTLRDVMTPREPMALDEALRMLEPVAAALDEAHAHGVVHRDLKPENIIIGTVGGKPVVKVTDLGIARLFDPPDSLPEPHTALTEPGQIMGTPHYMSPEQWGAPPDDGGPDIDARADVYSFGVIAYELLTGTKPFDSASVRQLCLAHVSRDAPDARDAAPGLPVAAAEAVARSLSKDRRDRQTSCGQLVEDLRAALPSEFTGASTSASLRWSTRRRLLAAAAVVLVVVAIVAAANVFRARNSVAPPPVGSGDELAPVAPMPATLLECSAVVQKYRDGRPVKSPLAVSVDRTLIVERGDRIRLDLVSAEPGWLYVLNETAAVDGAVSDLRVLFPVPWTNDGVASVGKRQTVTLPPANGAWIEFDDERGAEAFWIVWSAEPLAAFDGIAARANPTDRSLVESSQARTIREVLAAAPKPSADPDGSSGRTLIRGAAKVVAYRLEIQHY
jgi:serine/threonine protein kinase